MTPAAILPIRLSTAALDGNEAAEVGDSLFSISGCHDAKSATLQPAIAI
jgi:hypothetical protein